MDEPDIELAEVKVEQVILNRVGKRAIRLDAWAKSVDERQFNMEMQNDTKNDDVRKRSRFYQGLLDTPILKSGKKTRYKQLPSTVIIFITQDDIFKRDLAKYTFTERCKELDDIVQEVKASDEWESVKMNLLEFGIEKGMEQGKKDTLRSQVEKKLAKGYSVPEIADMLEETEKVIEEIIKGIKA